MADNALLKALMAEDDNFGYGYEARETPMGGFASGLAKSLPGMVNPRASNAANFATVLGGSLLAGLFGYQAKKQAEERNEAQAGYLQEILGGSLTPEREKEIMIADPKMKNFITGLKLRTLLGGGELSETKKAEIEVIKEFAKEKNVSFSQAEQMLKDKYAAGPAATPTPAPTPVSLIDESYDEAYKRLTQEALDLGLTGTQVSNYAKERILPKTAAMTEARKKIEKLGDTIPSSEKMVATLKPAIAGAGETGGFFPFRIARNLLSSMYQHLPTKGGRQEAEQRAFDKQIDSIGPALMGTLKGLGSISTVETEIALGSGPNSKNTPEANRKLLKQIEGFLQLEQAYLSALNSFASEGKGDFNQLWSQYKKEVALKDGVINDKRASFKDWLSSKSGTLSVVPGKSTIIELNDEEKLLEEMQRRGLSPR